MIMNAEEIEKSISRISVSHERRKKILELASEPENCWYFHSFNVAVSKENIIIDKRNISSVEDFSNWFSKFCHDDFSIAYNRERMCATMHSHDSDMRIGHYYVCAFLDLIEMQKYAHENCMVYDETFLAIKLAHCLFMKDHPDERMYMCTEPLMDFSERWKDLRFSYVGKDLSPFEFDAKPRYEFFRGSTHRDATHFLNSKKEP